MFKDATGTTPQCYINAKRLIFAKEKIKAGMPAGEVASSCGFSDYSSFYRAYKKYFSYAPSDDPT
ncbi:MAG: AraC family transcriptional regulator [Clostridia bacterium]|nr:AraC family transcriptional regulator [Clostridia bacterium]